MSESSFRAIRNVAFVPTEEDLETGESNNEVISKGEEATTDLLSSHDELRASTDIISP